MKFLFACVLGVLLHSTVAGAIDPPRSTPLITVFGNVSQTNRDAFAPERDLYFKHLGITFDRAAVFDAEMLAALPQSEIAADFPAGSATRRFSGPRLADLLKAVGADGSTVTVTAIDGYAAEIPMADVARFNPIFAIAEEGAPLALGAYGPGFVVFPRLDDPALKGMVDDFWVWGVIAISVR
tara:strand:+ start:461 stop:1006 length:546 start_codon:yes stop_codon:yes gene_type:complete